jgi:type I restriction enzyme, S subunit
MTDGPYTLPAGWRWVRLGEVATKPQYGYTQAATSEPAGPKFLRITDIQDSSVEWEKVPYCRCNVQALEKYKLIMGDILFARSGATTGKTFLVSDLPYEAIFASYLIRLKPHPRELLPEFALWFFKSPQYWDQIRPRGAAQPNMNAQALQRLILPLPPLAEQRRIMARVEVLMEQVREAKRLRADAEKDSDRLIEASTEEVISGLNYIPLRQLIAGYKNGIYKPMHLYGRGYPSVRMFNIRGGKVNLNKAPLLEVSAEELNTYGLVADDILIIRVNGSREIIGRAGLVSPELGLCTFESKTIRLRVKGDIVDPAFVVVGLNSVMVRRQLTQKPKTSSGQFTINQTDLNRLQVPFVDDLKAQRRIVAYPDSVRAQAAALKRAHEDTDAEIRRLE